MRSSRRFTSHTRPADGLVCGPHTHRRRFCRSAGLSLPLPIATVGPRSVISLGRDVRPTSRKGPVRREIREAIWKMSMVSAADWGYRTEWTGDVLGIIRFSGGGTHSSSLSSRIVHVFFVVYDSHCVGHRHRASDLDSDPDALYSASHDVASFQIICLGLVEE